MKFKGLQVAVLSSLLLLGSFSVFARTLSFQETEVFIRSQLKDQLDSSALYTMPNYSPESTKIELTKCVLKLQRKQIGRASKIGNWKMEIPLSKLELNKITSAYKGPGVSILAIETRGFDIVQQIETREPPSQWLQTEKTTLTNSFVFPMKDHEVAAELSDAIIHMSRFCQSAKL